MGSESETPEPKSGRLQNMALMEAVIAVCILAADADDDVQVCEMSTISAAIATDPALDGVDMDKAEALLADTLRMLEGDKAAAKRKLSDKIMRFFGDQNRSRSLMRVAYRIISSDHSIEEEEMNEFRRLCFMLDLDADRVFADSAAMTGQARDLGVL
jgi:tellurite resistance protein TerB